MGATSPSLKGNLLLDGGGLVGSFFHRTVVLVCEHDAKGAFGLVLNKVTEKRLDELLDEFVPTGLRELQLCLGGPVQPSAFSYLYVPLFGIPGSVLEDVSLGHSMEELLPISQGTSLNQRIKLFAGYAGWSPGQLDAEMERKSWISVPATRSWVFHPDPENLWKHIIRTLDWPQRFLADAPDDLSNN